MGKIVHACPYAELRPYINHRRSARGSLFLCLLRLKYFPLISTLLFPRQLHASEKFHIGEHHFFLENSIQVNEHHLFLEGNTILSREHQSIQVNTHSFQVNITSSRGTSFYPGGEHHSIQENTHSFQGNTHSFQGNTTPSRGTPLYPGKHHSIQVNTITSKGVHHIIQVNTTTSR